MEMTPWKGGRGQTFLPVSSSIGNSGQLNQCKPSYNSLSHWPGRHSYFTPGWPGVSSFWSGSTPGFFPKFTGFRVFWSRFSCWVCLEIHRVPGFLTKLSFPGWPSTSLGSGFLNQTKPSALVFNFTKFQVSLNRGPGWQC